MTGLRPILSVFCSVLLVFGTQLTATGQESPQQEAPKFTIEIVRGNDAQNNIKKGRATSEVVVEVRDRNKKPVAGALVTFAIPRGTGGTFPGGTQTTTVTTNANGQATAAFKPQGTGKFNINVSAESQGQTVTTTIAQTNIAAGLGAGFGLGTILLIGAAAAATAAIVVATRGGNDKTNVSLGSPRIP